MMSENVDKSFDYSGGSDSGCHNSVGANSGGCYDSNDNDGKGGDSNSSCNGFRW